MKKKIFLIFILICMLLFVIISQNKSQAQDEKIIEKNVKTYEVSNHDILKTLTTNGEVETSNLEKITLNTSYSYLTMCAEINQEVKKGENLLKYTNGTYITAPFDCVVISYSVPKAKSICTSSNYIYISSVENLNMNININEEQISQISVGQKVEIVPNSDETKTFEGTISKINEIGTYENGVTTFSAVTKLENDGYLKLGMSASCTITLEKLENVIAIPIEAVEIEGDKRYVNKLVGNSSEKTEIETGKADENFVQVISGLSLGEKIKYETKTITVNKSEETKTKSLFNFGGNNPRANGKGGF